MTRTTLSLNGTWQLQPSSQDAPIPPQWNHTAPVPALVNAAEPKYDWKNFRFHWYKTSFNVDRESDLAFVIIGQAMFGTAVWLNGKRLGEDIACYTSQEYDARKAIQQGTNDLVVRVGQREDLPPHNAAGKDQERSEWIPGIWGDVSLVQCGNPRIKLVQVIPHIGSADAEIRVTVENFSEHPSTTVVSTIVREKSIRSEWGYLLPRDRLESAEPLSGKPEGDGRSRAPSLRQQQPVTIPLKSATTVTFHHAIDSMVLWSPDQPFLYEAEARTEGDSLCAAFGMREFKIAPAEEGHSGFYLNDKRIFLRGGNIAFHRFLADPERDLLPWDPAWIKHVLIDIPKNSNFNFFRIHLGQMYTRWYDIADEYGILLQNEWMFWTRSGTKEQITREFTRWLQDNWNHPSIVIWDALNECSDAEIQNEIVPLMKHLDPTRPWAPVDFAEQHPYIYSLGPVLTDRQFGFSESLGNIEHSRTPSVVNEFVWWWLDKDWNPTILTQDVIERWVGKDYTNADLADRQSELAVELVELFRRMRVDAIQPFVYLSNNDGPTAHWFTGNIRELNTKPILRRLRDAFAPFAVSTELWDRHFFAGESRSVKLFLLNDFPESRSGIVRYGVKNLKGEWLSQASTEVSADASSRAVIPVTVSMPRDPGEYRMSAELSPHAGTETLSFSERIAHVFAPVKSPAAGPVQIGLLSGTGEISAFLTSLGFTVNSIEASDKSRILLAAEGMAGTAQFQARKPELTRSVRDGASLILVEPEFNTEGEIEILDGLDVRIARREDKERGGYDSYVFPEEYRHPLWKGIEKKHLQMFNGGFGGEIVSQHSVECTAPAAVHARCGLKLAVPAVLEIPYGQGKVLVSRLQTRGRLGTDDRHGRRPDPVLQRYMINLILYCLPLKAAGHDL